MCTAKPSGRTYRAQAPPPEPRPPSFLVPSFILPRLRLLLRVGAANQFSGPPSSPSPAPLLLPPATPPLPPPPGSVSRRRCAGAGAEPSPAGPQPVAGSPWARTRLSTLGSPRSAETGGRTPRSCGGRMAQTAMSETYGKTRGFADVCRGAGLGVPECWGLGSGSPEPVSRLSRYPANLAVSGARWR